MKHSRLCSLTFLPLSLACGMLLSLTPLTQTATAQTTNPNEIRAKIKQLESKVPDLNAELANVEEWLPLMDSDKYLFVANEIGLWPVSREHVERQLAIRVREGKMSQAEATQTIKASDMLKKAYKAELKKQQSELTQELKKRRTKSRIK